MLRLLGKNIRRYVQDQSPSVIPDCKNTELEGMFSRHIRLSSCKCTLRLLGIPYSLEIRYGIYVRHYHDYVEERIIMFRQELMETTLRNGTFPWRRSSLCLVVTPCFWIPKDPLFVKTMIQVLLHIRQEIRGWANTWIPARIDGEWVENVGFIMRNGQVVVDVTYPTLQRPSDPFLSHYNEQIIGRNIVSMTL